MIDYFYPGSYYLFTGPTAWWRECEWDRRQGRVELKPGLQLQSKHLFEGKVGLNPRTLRSN